MDVANGTAMTGMVLRAAKYSIAPIATAPPAAPARTASHSRRFVIGSSV